MSSLPKKNSCLTFCICRVISENKVEGFFTAPTAFRAIKQADPTAELGSKFDLGR